MPDALADAVPVDMIMRIVNNKRRRALDVDVAPRHTPDPGLEPHAVAG
jgi:hypothetical protein